MKDIEVTVNFRNNLIKARRLQHELSQKKLAELAGLHQQDITAYECFRKSPILYSGHPGNSDRKAVGWKVSALALATFFDVEVGELFPEHFHEIKKSKFSFEIDTHTYIENMHADQPLLPDKIYEVKNLGEHLRNALAKLTPREEAVIRMRFGIGKLPIMKHEGEHTLDEIASSFNVGRQRINQIELGALRKMRHPDISRILKDFVE